MQKLLISFMVCATLLSACSVHKLEIQQGNVVTPEMIQDVQTGMTSSQIRFVLGSPQLISPFHKDRWDYIYTTKQADGIENQRRLTVYFENEVVSKINDEAL